MNYYSYFSTGIMLLIQSLLDRQISISFSFLFYWGNDDSLCCVQSLLPSLLQFLKKVFFFSLLKLPLLRFKENLEISLLLHFKFLYFLIYFVPLAKLYMPILTRIFHRHFWNRFSVLEKTMAARVNVIGTL